MTNRHWTGLVAGLMAGFVATTTWIFRSEQSRMTAAVRVGQIIERLSR